MNHALNTILPSRSGALFGSRFERGTPETRRSHLYSLSRRKPPVRTRYGVLPNNSNVQFERESSFLLGEPSNAPEKESGRFMPKYTPPLRAHSSAETVSSLEVSSLLVLIDSFLLSGEVTGHSDRTIGNRRDRLTRLHWYACFMQWESVGKAGIQQFLGYLRRECPKGRWGNPHETRALSSGTVKSYHSSLRTFCNWCIAEGFLTSSPMENMPAPIDRPDQVQPFTQNELELLENSAKKNRKVTRRDEAIFLLLLDTGIRASELCSLSVKDINMASSSLRVEFAKGGKARTLPFSRDTKRVLFEYLKEYDSHPDDPVFLCLRGPGVGNRLARLGLLHLIYRWGENAGITRARCSPHTFRHTFAVSFLRNGGDVFTLKELLGHTSLAMVNRYVALSQADLSRQHSQHSPVNSFKKTKGKK